MVPFRIIFYLSDSWAQSGIEYFCCGDVDVDADDDDDPTYPM